LFKTFPVTGHKSFQLRAEFFNALNRAQFALPASALGFRPSAGSAPF
jgi:hypothetical protein